MFVLCHKTAPVIARYRLRPGLLVPSNAHRNHSFIINLFTPKDTSLFSVAPLVPLFGKKALALTHSSFLQCKLLLHAWTNLTLRNKQPFTNLSPPAANAAHAGCGTFIPAPRALNE